MFTQVTPLVPGVLGAIDLGFPAISEDLSAGTRARLSAPTLQRRFEGLCGEGLDEDFDGILMMKSIVNIMLLM